MDRKNIIYIGFSITYSFRSWNVSPMNNGIQLNSNKIHTSAPKEKFSNIHIIGRSPKTGKQPKF